MKLNSKCMACQIRKQEAKIRHFNDEDRKKQYMEAIRQRFEHPKDDDCVPSISTELKKLRLIPSGAFLWKISPGSAKNMTSLCWIW